MLLHGGMPRGSIAEVARLRREVEAVHLLISVFVSVGHCGVHRFLGGGKVVLATHHATTQEDDFGIRIMGTHLLVEKLVALQQQLGVGTSSRGVVGAKVDAHHLGGVA